eukprot:4127263-Ditylum_brightwellii.AAC.1
MTDGEIIKESLKNIKKNAQTFGIEKDLQYFAFKQNINLGKAPPLKKHRVNNTSDKTKPTLTPCTHDHDDVINYKSE